MPSPTLAGKAAVQPDVSEQARVARLFARVSDGASCSTGRVLSGRNGATS